MGLLIEGQGTLVHDDAGERTPETEAAAARLLVGDDSQPVREAGAGAAAHGDAIPDDTLVKIYIRIRDAKSAKAKEYDAEIAVLDGQLKKISTELLRRTQERHNTGIATDFGTVYIAETLKTSCADWGVFYDWIQKTPNGFEFLEQRIKAGSVKDYMEKNDGALPPGVNVFREFEARVRKPSASKKAASQ